MKKYRFELQKAINTPINAISDTSGSHLRDKLKRVMSMLNGDRLEVAGGKKISIQSHPHAPVFCKHLIARMIVVRMILIFS